MPTVQPKALTEAYLQTDRALLALILAHVPVVSFLVPIGQGTFTFALIASLIVAGIALAAYGSLRGTIACGAVFGACLMLISAIMIQARYGMIEMHFHIFASLAFLVIYRSWVPVMSAAVVIAIHHYLFNWFQMQGSQLGEMPIVIFQDGASWAIATVHAAFVVLETTVLIFICGKLAQQRAQAFQMMDVVEAFSESKDLTQRLDGSLNTASAESFNNMMSQFSGLVRTLRELSSALRHNADSLTDVSQKSSQTAADQSQEMESVASAINEMAETVGSVAENAQGASGASNEASKASDDGQQRMAQAQTLTRATETAMEDSARMVSELVEKVQSIDSVIASINGISEQTNLLALNAAIEAARAGEHGRGFSVVADEVRNLSLRTQEFTDEIRATIADLANGSEATLKAIETSQSRAKETSEAILGAGDSISQIRERITEVDTLNQQIASASEEQAATSQQINESVQKLHAQNEDVAAEANRTRVMSEELERIVRELDDVIRDYRVG